MQAQHLLFPNLFSPIQIGPHLVANRIVFTGHDTCLPTDGKVNEALIAYQEERAKNGTGLIVLQVSGVHESAHYTPVLLMADDDKCIEGYRRLVERCKPHGATIFAQIFHPGREIMESADGLKPVAYSASQHPQERFHVMPRALSKRKIEEIIDGYAQAARRLYTAGIDGVEVVASHGYLPAQFLDAQLNDRHDDYGGSFANRIRFLEQVIDRIRATVPEGLAVGIRISIDDRVEGGPTAQDCIRAMKHLESRLDYVSVVAGTSATLGGAIHIVPPMRYEAAYLRHDTEPLTQTLEIPVILTGRINQPQEAEAIIAAGQADLCGMTRALICDPAMPKKAKEKDLDGIRACIGCNQACIGHFHKGLPISCIQYPESGRELIFAQKKPIHIKKKVAVVGGGPAGMKAATVAAQRGHETVLFEASTRLGGQVLLAQMLPTREEFGGIITNLETELKRSGADICLNTQANPNELIEQGFDHIIMATGSTPYRPKIEVMGDMPLWHAHEVLKQDIKLKGHIVVYDMKGDWVGVGLAERFALEGAKVTLAVNGLHAGEALQSYVRDSTAARLYELGVQVVPYARLFGVDEGTVYCQHIAGMGHIIFEEVDHVVLATGTEPAFTADDEQQYAHLSMSVIGDCLAPRTAEEAVYEGLKAGWGL